VRLVLDQDIALSAEDAQAVLTDPAFYHDLGELPGISPPAVLSFSKGHGHARLVLGYRFSGQLPGAVRHLVDPERLTWSQETDVDLSSRHTEVKMVPGSYKGLFSFTGWYDLRDQGQGLCTQHLEADLRVHLPLLGPVAERAIAAGVRQNLAATARLVERYAASSATGT